MKWISALSTIDNLVVFVIRWLATVALVAMLILLALGVFVRIMPVFSMSGYDEIVELLFAWTVFLGAVVLWRDNDLFRVEIFASALSPPFKRLHAIIVNLLALAFAIVVSIQGWLFALQSIEVTGFLMVSKTPWYLSLPVASSIMVIYSLVNLLRLIRGLPLNSEEVSKS